MIKRNIIIISSLRRIEFKCFSSNQMPSYANGIYKKFLFYVHPDFFQNFESERNINEKNLKILSQLMDDKDNSVRATEFRTLMFYVKPLENEHSPRRVKVASARIVESIREILETLGIDLPPRPEAPHRASFIGSNPTEISSFLETLTDRKELMNWRLDRSLQYSRLKDVVIQSFGLEDIDIRIGWSAQNKCVLLGTLLNTLETHPKSFALPWTGLTLVISFDESVAVVDVAECRINLNPSRVPMQWVQAFSLVSHDLVVQANTQRQLSYQLTVQLEELLSRIIRRHLSMHNPLYQGYDVEGLSLRRFAVQLRKGHSCCGLGYSNFLRNTVPSLEESLALISVSLSTVDATAEATAEATVASSMDKLFSYSLSTDKTSDSSPSNTSGETSVRGTAISTSEIQLKEVTICVVVEEGHGSKLMVSAGGGAEIRLDCRIETEDLLRLITTNIDQCVTVSLNRELLTEHINRMSTEIVASLGLISIVPGVGVDAVKMESCLSRLLEFRRHNSGNWGAFRHLTGVRVLVGQYLGLADDGAFVLPWNWTL